MSLGFVWLGDGPETSLELRKTSSLSPADPTGPLSERIQIFLDEKKVEQLWLATFTLINDGGADIGVGDFGGPISFSSGSVKIEELIPGVSEPNGLQPSYIGITESGFELEPFLIKAREAITFSVVSSETLGNLEVSARIKGLSSISVESRLDNTPPDSRIGWTTPLIVFSAAVSIFAISGWIFIVISSYQEFRPKRHP